MKRANPGVNKIELLAPAKDLECGMTAINCGADAVYIGAARFGAREAAGNPVEEIAALAAHAHKYWARVYATINTLLRDEELPVAVALIRELYEAGVDGLILQDTGLLECDLPPLPLIASTQMNNATPEKVAFLEKVGFKRAILARELSLEQIRAIHAAAPRIELEFFVHGALCVCASGQCYLSYAQGGRSGNRGACAQPCRKAYTLVDATGRTIQNEQHLLSLKDLNLSAHLGELLAAGVSSFKIEGRLKDAAYVANTVAWYRAKLDEAIAAAGTVAAADGEKSGKSSSGTAAVEFAPDVAKTFNRGFTSHFLRGRGPAREKVGSPETPKMVGEKVGRVASVGRGSMTLESGALELHAGDGICFYDRAGRLDGSTVNAAAGRTVTPAKLEGLEAGMVIYRNHDHEFLTRLKKSRMERRIGVALTLREAAGGLALAVVDEDGVRAEYVLGCEPEAAAKPEAALENLRRQLQKMGGTDFICTALELERVCFLPVASINALRRGALEALAAARESARQAAREEEGGGGRGGIGVIRNEVPYPETELTYEGNVLNRRAEIFYYRHGVVKIAPAAESGVDLRGLKVMTTRYCLKHQLGLCARQGQNANDKGQLGEKIVEPLTLIDGEGHRLVLRFRCERCEMEIFYK